MNNIDIIGACSDLGVHVDGAKYGPEAIERNINLNNINNIYNVHAKEIKKDLSKDNLRKNLNEINEYNSELYSVVLNSLNNNMFPITLGGDHSIAIASGLASIKKYDNLQSNLKDFGNLLYEDFGKEWENEIIHNELLRYKKALLEVQQ